MQVEDYFEFDPKEIRIKGHRILMEDVLNEYLLRELTLEELVERFPTLSKDKILAVLLYYHTNQEKMDRYMTEWLEWCRKAEEENRREHADWYARMRQLKEQMQLEQEKQAGS